MFGVSNVVFVVTREYGDLAAPSPNKGPRQKPMVFLGQIRAGNTNFVSQEQFEIYIYSNATREDDKTEVFKSIV